MTVFAFIGAFHIIFLETIHFIILLGKLSINILKKIPTTFAYEYCHLKGDTYYFDDNSVMVKDAEIDIDGKQYKFDIDGKLINIR